ncbi:hypothetical protein ACS0TY_025613 [Phlomoides rotata]
MELTKCVKKLVLRKWERKDTLELLLSLKKDVNELVEKYMVRLVELSQEKHPSNSSSPYDDDFFKNIDELVKTFLLTKRLADDGVTDLGEEEEVRKVEGRGGVAPSDVDMENIAVEQSVQLPQEEEESQQVLFVHSSCSTLPQKRRGEDQEEEESPAKRKKDVDETDGAAPPPPGKTIKINKHVIFLLRKLLILDFNGILADIVEFPGVDMRLTVNLVPNLEKCGWFSEKHLMSHIFFFVWDGDECDNVGDIPTEFGSGKRLVVLKKIEMCGNIGRSVGPE